MLAIGRDACTPDLKLDVPGVKVNPKTGKILGHDEATTASHVFAVGDVLDGKPELTPVAIHAGKLLSERLFDPDGGDRLMDYINIPTTVFTPLEYGAIGYSEEEAIRKFGEDNIEVFHTLYRPLEWALPKRPDDACYGKIICNKRENLRVVGFHVCGPNAGEITQGYAIAMKCGATKKHFDDTIGMCIANISVILVRFAFVLRFHARIRTNRYTSNDERNIYNTRHNESVGHANNTSCLLRLNSALHTHTCCADDTTIFMLTFRRHLMMLLKLCRYSRLCSKTTLVKKVNFYVC